MSANETQSTFNRKIAQELGIGNFANFDRSDPEETKKFGLNKRPDLTFLLANISLMKVVIVELKAPNTPLHFEHLRQLKRYIRKTEDFIKSTHGHPNSQFNVKGILIGCRALSEDSRAEKVLELKDEEDKRSDKSNWEVMTLMQVLERTELAHREIIDVHEQAIRSDSLIKK